MLSLLTLNIQAAALPRAQGLLRWLEARGDDLLILTETSAGEGTAYLLDQCRRAGLSVVHTPSPGDRGVALISRLPIETQPDLLAGVTLPGRVATATIAGTDPPLTVVGVYVPSSDRAPDKIARKRDFITSLLTALRGFPEQVRARLVLGGDYNVITRDHLPPYRGFLPFEYGMLDALHDLGLVDAHEHCAPGAQAHSWIGRSGNGYRFDYVHIAAPLTDRLVDVRYVHDPRERQLTDHAAVTVSLCVPVGARLPVDPAGLVSTGLLF